MKFKQLIELGRHEFNEWRRANPEPFVIENADVGEFQLTNKRGDVSGPDLSGYDLSGVTFSKSNLGGLNLKGAQLHDSRFLCCNLRCSDLSDAHLEGAYLSGCDATECNLRGAVITGATVESTWMRQADLHMVRASQATLKQVDLTLARMTSTKLSGATLDEVFLHRNSLADCDLSNSRWRQVSIAGCDMRPVIGLGTVLHERASSIATDVLARSHGEVTRSFLINTGMDSIIADYLIESATASTRNPLYDFQSVFLSHASRDKPVVRRVYDYLVDAGVSCWLDEVQMFPGDDPHLEIANAIKGAERHAIFFSREMLKSWWVNKEIRLMMAEEQRRTREQGSPVTLAIPVDLDGALFDESLDEPWSAEMRQRIAARLDDRSSFGSELDRLLAALRVGGPPRPFASSFQPAPLGTSNQMSPKCAADSGETPVWPESGGGV